MPQPKKLTPRGQAATPPGESFPKPIAKPAPKAKKPATKASSNRKYVRNLRGVLIRVKLDSGRQIILEPRGQRNDFTAVNKDEQEDSSFLNNLGILFEVITAKEADAVREKQSTNMLPTPSQILNEHGKPMNVVITDPNSVEVQGVTVATLSETEGGNFSQSETLIQRISPDRVAAPGSVDNPVGLE